MMKFKSDLIEALGVASLPVADQEAILEKVDRRLEEVILRVLAENLSDEEARKMRDALREGEDIEDKVAKMAMGVPRLAAKIEEAIIEEVERLRMVLAE